MAQDKERFPLGDLPRGFSFEGDGFREFLETFRPSSPPEPLRGIPEGAAGTIPLLAVEGIPLSQGPAWKAFAGAFRLLEAGGEFYLRVPNSRVWHRVKRALDGRGSLFGPAGALHDPLLPLSREELSRSLFSCGFVVREIVDVPGMVPVPGRELLEALWVNDLDGASLTREGRVEWYLVRAVKEEPLAGSVLLAASSREEASGTMEYLERILPPRWEVKAVWPGRGESLSETEAWNRAFTQSRGDRIWLLRGGQRPPEDWLPATAPLLLRRKTCVFPGDRSDLAGLLIHRMDLLTCGPLPWYLESAPVAAEEFRLAMTRGALRVEFLPADFQGPPPPAEKAAEEAEAFLERWSWQEKESLKVRKRAKTHAEAPWKGREPRVSLCMMARNEESCLERCLRSALPAVDEIVLVDTGSTDRTVEIARSFGAKVVHFPWNGSFSEPRNAGLKECGGDWILVLDADEELAPGAAEKIRKAVKDPSIAAYHLTIHNINDGREKTHGVKITRLFRNLPGIRFTNRIHEQVIHSLMEKAEEMGLTLGEADIDVIHRGYVSEVMERKGKKDRNWELFEKQLEERPDDHYSWYKFGDFLRRFGTPRESTEKFQRALELIERLPDVHLRQVPYAAEVATLLALEAAKREEYEKAESLLVRAFDRFMATPNTWYIAAGVAVRTGRPELALELYDRCLGFRGAVLVVPVEDGLTGYASWHAMGAAWSMKGFHERAKEYMEAALREKPDYLPGVLGCSALLLEEGDPSGAVEILLGYLKRHPGEDVVRRQAASILERIGLKERARLLRGGPAEARASLEPVGAETERNGG